MAQKVWAVWDDGTIPTGVYKTKELAVKALFDRPGFLTAVLDAEVLSPSELYKDMLANDEDFEFETYGIYGLPVNESLISTAVVVNGMREGDRVRFRSWDDMTAEFGLDGDGDILMDDNIFNYDSMGHLCGTEATIVRIIPYTYLDKEVYEIILKDFSAQGDTDFYYSIGMLEKVN